jgi:hypothetical protein
MADATPLTAAGGRPALTGPAAAGNEYENLAHHRKQYLVADMLSRWMS